MIENNKMEKITVEKFYNKIETQILDDDEKDVFIENINVDKNLEFTENAAELDIITEEDKKKYLRKDYIL